jgi:hypothetical protein
MKQKFSPSPLLAGFAACVIGASAFAQTQVKSSVQSTAGGVTRSGPIKLTATAGQPSPLGKTSRGNLTLASGFIYTLDRKIKLPSTAAPASASSLLAEALDENKIFLSWADNSNNEDGFQIERRVGIAEAIFFNVGPNVTSYLDDELDPGTRVTYRVFAFNAAGDALASNTAVDVTATGVRGDVTRDFDVDVSDVNLTVDIIFQSAARRITRLDSLTANTTGDSSNINVIDVVDIVNISLQGLLASTGSPAASIADSATIGELRLGAAELTAGTPARLPLAISVAERVTALQFKFRYDNRALVLGEPILSPAAEPMALAAAREKDQLAILIYSTSGHSLPAGQRELLQLPLRAIAGDFPAAGLQIESVLVLGEGGRVLALRIINEAENLKAALPNKFALRQNYPNPFLSGTKSPAQGGGNSETEIVYALPRAAQARLSIYDLNGREIAVLVDEWQTAGNKKVRWDGRDQRGERVASGLYFYRLQVSDPARGGAHDFVATRKLIIAK